MRGGSPEEGQILWPSVSTTLTVDSRTGAGPGAEVDSPPRLGFVLLWSRDEPQRTGEVSLVLDPEPGSAAVLGRGEPPPGEPTPRMLWVRQQPGRSVLTGPLRSQHISRVQLRVEVIGPEELQVSNLGRCPLLVGGREVSAARVRTGDILELRNLALLMCLRRPVDLPVADPPLPLHAFGEADATGLVGESPAVWELRAHIAFAASRAVHVLVRGPSGTGKELVAQAIHRLSSRGQRPLVARNAATFPETLIDAELFGNARGFPNPGMPERPGLIGEADGSTLFLDEFAELPQALQAHLLRVLDGGEYTRLGESRSRRADFRLVAATNRPESALKEDVLARLRLRLELPGLGERREDIPLLVIHSLRRFAQGDAQLARRYFPGGDPSAIPRVSPALIEHLVRHPYTTHVRELEAQLWRALSHSHGDTVTLWSPQAAPPPAVSVAESEEGAEKTAPPLDLPGAGPAHVDPMSLPPEVIQACLDKHEGRQEPVWRELGLSSRHVLTRLVRKYGLNVRGR
jgi:DNA-binding NtrC family response regulator